MKKLFGILSLAMLLFSTFAPSFTYANEVEDLAKEILTEEVNNVGELFNNGNNVELMQDNDNVSTFSTDSDNPHIVYDEGSGLITVYTGDYSYGITLQDKNLGTNISGTGTESFGNYYKWGVNSPWEIGNTDGRYVGYVGSWGGGNDYSSPYGYNSQTHTSNNLIGRRGPCDNGYHIPSKGERNELKNLYNAIKTDNGKIYEDLRIPLNGYYNIPNDEMKFRGERLYLRSSSYYYSTYGQIFVVDSGGNFMTPDGHLGEHGIGIRCFKDEYVKKQELTITFDLGEGGYWITETGDKLREPTHNVTYTYDENSGKYKTQGKWRTPSRISNDLSQQTGWMFDGWYTNPNCSTNYEYCTNKWLGIEGPYLAEGVGETKVYAKWLPFNDLEVEIDGEKIVIMDRNLGATTNDITNVGSYGNFYQRGNNYGFSRCSYNGCNIFNDGETKTNIKVSKSDWEGNVSTYYNSTWNTNDEWNEGATDEDNLWGGSKFNNFDTFRQGPCPDGYHVPIGGNYAESEWHRIYDKWGYEGNDSNDSLKFSNDLNLPFAGYRSNGGTMNNQNSNGYYLTSNPYYSSTNPFYNYIFRIDYNPAKIYPNAYSYAGTHGRSIRCFKDTSKIIHFETNSDNTLDDISSIRWWNFSSQNLPKLSFDDIHMDFKGRFLTSNFLPETEVKYIPETSQINGDSLTLYAKIECERGFIRDGNKCIGPKTAILMTGMYLNVALKGLVRGEDLLPYYDNFTSSDELIKGFVFSDNIPEDKITISADYSDLPIYARYDSNSGTMYYYSEAEKIYLNPDSSFLFAGFDGIKELDLSKFNPHLTKLSMYGIVLNTHNLENLILDGWDVSNYPNINMGSMFDKAYGLKHLSLKNRIIPSYFESMIGARNTSLSSNLDSVDVSNRDLSSTYSLMGLFGNLKTKNIIGLDTWDTSNIVIMQNMFGNLSGVDTLDLSSWNTNNVREMNGMFHGSNVEELDLSSFNTENMSNLGAMFSNNSSLKTIYVGKEFVVNSYINSGGMFLNATNIVGGNGTTYNPGHIDGTYAVIDDKNNSGYFTDILDKQFSISYDLDGGVISGEIYKYTGRDSFTLPIPEKSGYTFKGWIGSNLANPKIYVTINQGTKGDLSYYAQRENTPEQDEQEGQKEQIPSAGGGSTINPSKKDTKSTEQEHNSADKVEIITEKNQTTDNQKMEEKINKVQERSLTRGEIAVMTNILLDVYPQLTEGRELNEVSEACENYTDEQNFTKDEKKAITRLCKLSIMGIHADDNKPLEEFLVNDKSTNDEFSKVINRSLSTYTEKDFSVVKEALKKLEGDEDNVVFGTVYEVFMNIKNIFN